MPPPPIPDPDVPPAPEEDQPAPLPSIARDPQLDPQAGDQLLWRGQLRSVIRRDGNTLLCKDGAIAYKTTVQRWQEWCRKRAEEDAEEE
jgi:hypothetical protein